MIRIRVTLHILNSNRPSLGVPEFGVCGCRVSGGTVSSNRGGEAQERAGGSCPRPDGGGDEHNPHP